MTESHGRSLPWFRVDVDIVDHPKIHSLATHLEVTEAEAGWSIIRLFAWTMRYAARGRLAPGARTALGRLAPGARTALGRLAPVRVTSDRFVDGLISAGWVDALADGSLEIHDWDEHNGAAVAKAEKDAERKRAARARRSNGRGQSADGRADGAGNGTERNGTGRIEASAALFEPPQRVKPKRSKPDRPTDPRHAPLVARLVAAFKADRETPYPFGPRDAKVVSNLLARAEPDTIVAAWERALRHQGFPTVGTLAQLEQHLAQFIAAPRPPVRDITKGVAPVSDWATIGEDGGVF